MKELFKGKRLFRSEVTEMDSSSSQSLTEKDADDQYGSIHRQLETRHVQLISIGGSIGTGLFVTIGTGLITGGPLGLFLAYCFWTTVVGILITAVGEFVCYLPIASPFVAMAGRCVDEALECCAGWNFFIAQALSIPFEITAVNSMIHFWRDDYSPAITLCIEIFIYAFLNVFAVSYYGESEFWLSIGKLVLCIGLIFFTFITMCGGNPQHDAFGFRNWNVSGGPFAEYITTGSLGKFEGFLGALLGLACFTVVGVEYMSMVAAEAKNPRKTMVTAFKTVSVRLVLFFILGSLSVTILVAYNDPYFVKMSSAASNAAASPYVIAMQNMGIKVLPSIVNALVLSSAFSTGNSCTYCSSRALYGLAKRGFAPKFLRKCTERGVPIYCVAIACCFSLLSLLQLGSTSQKALSYMVNLCTGSFVINYAFMSVTYIGFYRACKAQNIDRKSFNYVSWGQPYTTYVACFFFWIVVGILGYSVFIPGRWAVDTFLFSYLMVFINIAIFTFWKVFKKTKLVKPEEADLKSGLEEIEEHEYQYYAELEAKGKSDDGIFKKLFSWVL
ncbi:uncharacterized protein PRCAT00004237001 [Priceomyces carsonii]|uniref:uncharacterized protein n=1 Tax=Priceomyces carsonii TaxID=28549 RepID=UPI002ED8B452|nr:unnamed protein product [Priceomyces carsonii]